MNITELRSISITLCIALHFGDYCCFPAENADRQIKLLHQMAVGCPRLQYLVNQNVTPPVKSIQPNTHFIDHALSESHVDAISAG